MKMGFLLSVSIRVHPWLDHIGCGFAALRSIAGCHPAGLRPGRDAGTPPNPCRFAIGDTADQQSALRYTDTQLRVIAMRAEPDLCYVPSVAQACAHPVPRLPGGVSA